MPFADLLERWSHVFFDVLLRVIQTLGMILLLAIEYGKIFKIEVEEYVPSMSSGKVLGLVEVLMGRSAEKKIIFHI